MSSATATTSTPCVERLIRRELVLKMVPFSRNTLTREIDAGRFPKPRRVSKRILVWNEAEIRNWLASVGTADQATVAAPESAR
jgi:prophage regulatory protein